MDASVGTSESPQCSCYYWGLSQAAATIGIAIDVFATTQVRPARIQTSCLTRLAIQLVLRDFILASFGLGTGSTHAFRTFAAEEWCRWSVEIMTPHRLPVSLAAIDILPLSITRKVCYERNSASLAVLAHVHMQTQKKLKTDITITFPKKATRIQDEHPVCKRPLTRIYKLSGKLHRSAGLHQSLLASMPCKQPCHDYTLYIYI